MRKKGGCGDENEVGIGVWMCMRYIEVWMMSGSSGRYGAGYGGGYGGNTKASRVEVGYKCGIKLIK